MTELRKIDVAAGKEIILERQLMSFVYLGDQKSFSAYNRDAGYGDVLPAWCRG
jgi:hypothetical protein